MSDTVHYGIHGPLEDAANELIYESLRGVTSQEAKSDILTPWKEQARRSREVLASSGTVDAHTRKGMYHRVANKTHPYLNSRDGMTRGNRTPRGPMHDDWILPAGSFIYVPESGGS
jgi:hypothetical protein